MATLFNKVNPLDSLNEAHDLEWLEALSEIGALQSKSRGVKDKTNSKPLPHIHTK